MEKNMVRLKLAIDLNLITIISTKISNPRQFVFLPMQKRTISDLNEK